MNYFTGTAVGGGTEAHMAAVQEWWEANRERVRAEAERRAREATPDNTLPAAAGTKALTPRRRGGAAACV